MERPRRRHQPGNPTAASYVFCVADGTSTSYRKVTGGTVWKPQRLGDRHRLRAPGNHHTAGPDTRALFWRPAALDADRRHPDVINLAGAWSGTTITWTWNGSFADTNYMVTLLLTSDSATRAVQELPTR
jgi:hypothetical protein